MHITAVMRDSGYSGVDRRRHVSRFASSVVPQLFTLHVWA